jgi:hypothetical protein
MSSHPLTRLFSATALFLSLGVGATAASTSKVESLGDSTFAITRTATTGFDRDVKQFRQEAEQDAAKYCADQGKVLKVVAVTSDRPHFGGGYASAKIVFKALEAGDPVLTAVEPAPPVVGGAAVAAAPAGVLPTYAGDFYSELLKLDDLRKRGLLTDKEFEQQKKKLLKKSK